MQTMLRMVGFGDDAGRIEPVLEEDTRLNEVTLTLKMISEHR